MTAVSTFDPQVVLSSAYGTAFALEYHARRGLGATRSPKLNREIAHEAMTIARAAVDGWDALEELARGMGAEEDDLAGGSVK